MEEKINRQELGFEVAFKVVNGEKKELWNVVKMPHYSTKHSAGADLYTCEDVVVPSHIKRYMDSLGSEGHVSDKPTINHTGIKLRMGPEFKAYILARSSTARKYGLMLSNNVGLIDADYYGCDETDGEVSFSVYNMGYEDVTIPAGTPIGQIVFGKYYRPDDADVLDVERKGGYGSTNR